MNYGKRSTSKKQKSMHSKSVKAGKKASVIFIKAFLVCLLAAGVIGLCAGIGIVKGVIDNAPDIDSTSVIPRGYKSVMVDSDGNKMAELITAGSNRVWVDIDNIPEHVQKAFVDVEDERFYKHNGIDLKGIIRAGMKGIASGFRKTEGASTITQQLAKNLYFTQEKVLTRKAAEAFMAWAIEKQYTKDEILELYVNSIYFGSGYYNVRQASEGYFGKAPAQMTPYECTLLAGVPNAPSAYDPAQNPGLAGQRQKKVVEQMVERGCLSAAQAREALTPG